MIQNLKDELYQLENKQPKDVKLCANMRQELEGKKCSKTFVNVLERQRLQNQRIFELYTDENKSKYFSNPKDILKSEKKKQKKKQQKQPLEVFYKNGVLKVGLSRSKKKLFYLLK